MIARQGGDRHGMAQADRCHRMATRRLPSGCVAIEAEHHGPPCREATCSNCVADSSRPDWVTGQNCPAAPERIGGNRDRHRVEGAFDDDHLTPPSGGRGGKRLIEVDGLVIRVRTRRVLVLRPAVVAHVASYEAADSALLVPDRDQHSLTVEVGDPAVRVAMGEPGIDQLVVGEPVCPHRGHKTSRV